MITPVWFGDGLKTAKVFVRFAGRERVSTDLRPDDFARYRLHLYDHYGVLAIARDMTVVKAIFKHAYDAGLIDRPIRYGGKFDKPTAKEKRQNRARHDREHGKRLFTPSQIRLLLASTDRQMKAMILLGINGGFGNTDCAELPIAAVDLVKGIIDYERPKTAVQRIVPLWNETVEAIKAAMEVRPKPKNPAFEGLVFITKYGKPWKRELIKADSSEEQLKATKTQPISAEFRKLLKRLNLHRYGLGFYALRHTFRTWADEVKDEHAVHRIMGHTIPGMSGIYVEEIGLDRLRAVVNHVRSKIFSQ